MSVSTPADPSPLADQARGLLQGFGPGGSLAHALDLSERELEALYALGLGLYRQDRLDDALAVFQWLVQMDPSQRHWLHALASCQQRLGHHERALAHWAVAQWHDPDDPDPGWHSVRSLLALGRPWDAAAALDPVLRQCAARPDRAVLGRRATALQRALADRLALAGSGTP